MGDCWWQLAWSTHQTAPPGTKPVVGRPREPAPAAEGNRGRSVLVRAARPGQCGEVLYPGAGSTAESKVASLRYSL